MERAKELVRVAWRDPRRRELGLYAAGGTYYLFLSLGPLTAVLLALLPFTPLTEQALTDGVLSWVPPAFRRLMQGVAADVYAAPRGAALGLSLVTELWSGARFLAGVSRAVRALAGESATGYLRRRVRAAAYTAALMLFILGNLLLLRFGERLLLAAELRAPGGRGLWRVLLRGRALLLWAGMTAGVLLLSRPAASEVRRRLIPAALTAGGWMGFSRLYAWAMERFGLFGVYGSIAAAAASLVWMYACLYMLYAGVWLCALGNQDS